jgi:small-conductance mechanosensitive channel
MTPTAEERPITERVPERPSFSPDEVRKVGFRALGIRFIAGALTSIVAGVVTLAFGSHVGGILLAFPAILAASLTLIEQKEDSAEAREDARGAVVGGLALGTFAAVGAVTLGHVNTAVALALATAGWFAIAIGGYFVAWFK